MIAQGKNVIAIPGTQHLEHLVENIGANNLLLDDEVMGQVNKLVDHSTVSGARYGNRGQASVTTVQCGCELQVL